VLQRSLIDCATCRRAAHTHVLEALEVTLRKLR
jgi:hypothetical protein